MKLLCYILGNPITESLSELVQISSKVNHRQLQQFSADAQYLATYEPIFPNTLWIWNLTSQPLLDTIVVLRDDSFVYGKLSVFVPTMS